LRRDKKEKTMAYYVNEKIELYLNLDENNLIYAPTRWGKTTELAKISKFAIENGYFPFFLSPNLKSLTADWEDKHEWIKTPQDVRLYTSAVGDDLSKNLREQGRPGNIIWGSHRYPKWMTQFLTKAQDLKAMYPELKLLFLVDEAHGIGNDCFTTQEVDKMLELGTVIGTTATPQRIVMHNRWNKYHSIKVPDGYIKPYQSHIIELDRDKELTPLIKKQILSPTILREFDKEFHGPAWSLCVINGQTFVARWQILIIDKLRKIYPHVTIVHVSGSKYTLYDAYGSDTIKTINLGKGDKKPGSVQQVVTYLFDHKYKDTRDELKLVVIGHNQIEEGQTHGNFSGDRFAKLQLLASANTVKDDKFAQYVRVEPEKAKEAGAPLPRLLVDKDQWTDYKAGTRWLEREMDRLSTDPDRGMEEPPKYISNMTQTLKGVRREVEPDENLSFFTTKRVIKLDKKLGLDLNHIFTTTNKRRSVSQSLLTVLREEGIKAASYIKQGAVRLMYNKGYIDRFLYGKKWYGPCVFHTGENEVTVIDTDKHLAEKRKLYKLHDPSKPEGYGYTQPTFRVFKK